MCGILHLKGLRIKTWLSILPALQFTDSWQLDGKATQKRMDSIWQFSYYLWTWTTTSPEALSVTFICHWDTVSEALLTMNESDVILFASKMRHVSELHYETNKKKKSPLNCVCCVKSPVRCRPDSGAWWHPRSVVALLFLALWETYQYIQVWNNCPYS